MKATCGKDALVNGVSLAERATGKNLPLAVLSSLLIIAENNTLTVRATNLDLGIEVTVPAHIETSGSVAVSGTLLQQLLNGIADGETVALTSTENGIQIGSTSNSAVLTTQSHEDFPTLPSVTDGTTITMPAGDLQYGLKSVYYAASQSTIKPELNSVYVAAHELGQLTCAATDSFRLAEKTLSVQGLETFEPILIPVKNIPEVLRMLEKMEGEVTVSVTQNQLAVSGDRIYLTSRLVDGSFPDYRQIIPAEHVSQAVVLKQDILRALKTANVFVDKFSRVTFSLSPEENSFTLQTSSADTGTYTATLDATLSGEVVTLAFNHRYVMDCFQSIPTDSVTLQFSGEGRPLVIQGAGDSSFLYLVMPMHT